MRLALFLFCLLCMAGSASAQINLVVCADPNQPPGDQNPPTRCPLVGNLTCPVGFCTVGANGGCAVGNPSINFTMWRSDYNNNTQVTTPIAGSPGKAVRPIGGWVCYVTRECKCVPDGLGSLHCVLGPETVYSYWNYQIMDGIGCIGPDL